MRSELFSFVLPAFNEAKRLPRTLAHLSAMIRQKSWQAEIIVVNDGSTDRTSGVVRWWNRRNPNVYCLELPGRSGKGGAVREGVRHAKGDVIFFCDSDLGFCIRETARLEKAVRAGADLAISNRIGRRSEFVHCSPSRQFASKAFRSCTRLILPVKVADTQCGLKACTAAAAKVLFGGQTVSGWAFDLELLAIARANHLKITEVDVKLLNHPESRFRLFPDAFKCIADVLVIRANWVRGKYVSAPVVVNYCPDILHHEEAA